MNTRQMKIGVISTYIARHFSFYTTNIVSTNNRRIYYKEEKKGHKRLETRHFHQPNVGQRQCSVTRTEKTFLLHVE